MFCTIASGAAAIGLCAAAPICGGAERRVEGHVFGASRQEHRDRAAWVRADRLRGGGAQQQQAALGGFGGSLEGGGEPAVQGQDAFVGADQGQCAPAVGAGGADRHREQRRGGRDPGHLLHFGGDATRRSLRASARPVRASRARRRRARLLRRSR